MSPQSTGDESHGDDLVLSRRDVAELVAYLLACAELCTREPYYYGSYRLLDGAGRLAGYALRHGATDADRWLVELKREIDERKGLLMWDRDAYHDYVQGVTGKVAEQLKGGASR